MDDFLDKLRKDAVYFKLTSKPKFGGAVSVEDIINVLKSLKESYFAFVDSEYSKVNTQQDRRKLSKILKGLYDENNLMVVDLKFASCGMALSPNILTHSVRIPEIKDQNNWKKEVFADYKLTVLSADYNDKDYLELVKNRFNPTERQRIFKPIVDGIINNERAKTTFGFGSNDTNLKALSTPKVQTYSVLIPKSNFVEAEPIEVRTSMAMVELKGSKAKAKILELFEEIKNPVYQFNSIEFNGTKYNLKFPLSCELTHEDEAYVLENKGIGITSFGKTIEEAQKGFFEEFDFIYKRYNSLAESELNADVLRIKKYLNLIVL